MLHVVENFAVNQCHSRSLEFTPLTADCVTSYCSTAGAHFSLHPFSTVAVTVSVCISRTDNVDVDDVTGLTECVGHGDAVGAGVVRRNGVDDESCHLFAAHHLHLHYRHVIQLNCLADCTSYTGWPEKKKDHFYNCLHILKRLNQLLRYDLC